MPFNPDAYLAKKTAQPSPQASGGFDPDAYLKKKAGAGTESKGLLAQIGAGAESIGRGALMGTAPYVVAGTQKLIDMVTPGEGEKEQSFTELRDAYSKRQNQQREDFPVTTTLGEIAGSFAPGIGISKLVKPAASTLGRIAQAGVVGAGTGLIQTPEAQEGELSFQIPERLEQAKTGAILGPAIQAGAEGLSAVGRGLKGLAERRAFKGGGAMLKDYRKAMGRGGKERVQELGREMLDSGLSRPGDTYDDIAEKSGLLKKDVGAKIGEIYDTVNEQVQKMPERFTNSFGLTNPARIKDELTTTLAKTTPKIGKKQFQAATEEIVNEIVTSDPNSLRDVR
jgi:hypothetical protein